jgi:hypothetical protein
MKKSLLQDIGESKDANQVKSETRTAMFWVDEDQLKKLNDFASNHKCPMRYHGAIGGALTYSFAPTTLGVVVKVTCACGAEVDVSDYEGW